MFTNANDRPNNPNIAVFFTDGKASDKKLLFEAANEAKSKGTNVFLTLFFFSLNNTALCWVSIVFNKVCSFHYK